jgi:hypothetical protein
VFFAGHWEAYAELISAEMQFKPKQKLMGLNAIISGNAIGLGDFVGRHALDQGR